MSEDRVTVPPGHRVVVVHAASTTQCGYLQSGWFVLDFGAAETDWRALMRGAIERLGRRPAPALLILQQARLASLHAAGEFVPLLQTWQAAKLECVWVLPLHAADDAAAVAAIRGSGFGVRDVGSLNGTYVNREPVDEAELGGGDEIQIGKFRMVLLTKPRR